MQKKLLIKLKVLWILCKLRITSLPVYSFLVLAILEKNGYYFKAIIH